MELPNAQVDARGDAEIPAAVREIDVGPGCSGPDGERFQLRGGVESLRGDARGRTSCNQEGKREQAKGAAAEFHADEPPAECYEEFRWGAVKVE